MLILDLSVTFTGIHFHFYYIYSFIIYIYSFVHMKLFTIKNSKTFFKRMQFLVLEYALGAICIPRDLSRTITFLLN